MSNPYMMGPAHNEAYKRLFDGREREAVLASLDASAGDFYAIQGLLTNSHGYSTQATARVEQLITSLLVALDTRATPEQITKHLDELAALQGELSLARSLAARAALGASHLAEHPDQVERYAPAVLSMIECLNRRLSDDFAIAGMRDAIEAMELPADGAGRLLAICDEVDVLCEVMSDTHTTIEHQVRQLSGPQVAQESVGQSAPAIELADLPPVAQIAKYRPEQNLEP